MFNLKYLLWLSIACLSLAGLTVGPAIAANAPLAAEVFLDDPATPPGSGTGLVLSGLDSDALRTAAGELDLTGVSSGSHTVYLRFQDSEGVWSDPIGQSFYVVAGNGGGPLPGTQNQIEAAEAFIDSDPGEGNGVALDTAADGAIDSAIEILGGTVPLDGLAIGVHVLYTRTLDSTGIWSPPVRQTFYVPYAVDPGAPGGTVTLLSAEGFIDNGPAISLDADDGTFDDRVETVTLIEPVSEDYHSVRIRFQDSQGLWSDSTSGCYDNNVLSGYLIDATTNQPFQHVPVTAGGTSVDTDEDGYYVLNDLPCGPLQLRVDIAGYEPYLRSVDPSTGGWINIRLTRESTTNGVVSESAIYGDPVNTATGNYVYQRRDLEIPGIGLPFRFERSYNSRDSHDGPLGFGWTHNWNISLEVDGAGNVTIRWGDGHTETWAPDGAGGFIPQYGVFDALVDDGGGTYTLQKRDRTVYRFDAFGALASVTDKNGNRQELTYTGGNLTRITDTTGRHIDFTYDANGRIQLITDPIGRTIEFSYDLDGNLVTAIDPNGNTTQYNYDSDHQILSIVDPRGHTIVSNTYDADNRVVTYQTDAKGGETRYDYQELDRITTITDALGNTIVHQHDELLRLIKETDPNGGITRYGYDALGNRIEVTDKNGNTTRYDYDLRGNVTRKTDALGNITTITYDENDNPLSRTDALGNVTRFTYDANGNLTETLDALAGVTDITYDEHGLPLTVTDPLGNVTSKAYDAEGNLTQVTDALGNSSSHTYDGVGRRLTETDPLGRTTSHTYDANDNRLTLTNPAGGLTTHTYDANDNRITTNDPNGNLTQYIYDEKDLKVGTIDALGNTWSYSYDALDRKTGVTDSNGHTAQYEYDGVGNQTRVIDPLGNATQYTYDPNGNRLTRTNARGNTTTYTYDALNRRTRATDPLGQSTTTAYDALGRVASVTTAAEQVTVNSYDALGRLAQVTDALGNTTQYSYDANGNRVSQQDPNGNTTLYTYDLLNRRVAVTDPLGHATLTAYDSAGQVTAVTDANGHVTQLAYDPLGRLVQTTDAAGGTNLSSYDANGNRLTRTDANGHITQYVYDPLNRNTRITDPLGNATQIAYDSVGNRVTQTDPNGNLTQYRYDPNNRLIEVTDPLGNATQTNYDQNGNRIQTIDPLGHATAWVYDKNNRKVEETDALGNATNTAYDPVGRVLSTTDAAGQISRFEYDLLDHLNRVTDAGGGVVQYAYDANGNRVGMTDPNGQTTSYTYDALNRRIGMQEPLGNATLYQYDPVGNVSQRTDARGQITQYNYDTLDRLVRTDYPGPDDVLFSYDAVGNLLQLQDSLGTTTHGYDANNRRISTIDPFGQQVQYGYDANGNRTRLTYPGGRTVSYSYNAADRLTTVSDWLTRETRYTYDASGRLTDTTNPNGTTAQYAYDAADRLTGLSNAKSDATLINSYAYTLDVVGNHLQEDRFEPLLPAFASNTTSNTLDAENRLIESNGTPNGFDANGNMTAKGANSYSYDTENRLTQTVIGSTATQYRYDGLGNRYERARNGTTTRFVLDTNTRLTNVLAETDASGAIQAYNLYGLGLIARIRPDGSASYYHYDSRGSTVAISDETETINGQYAYDPFGRVVASGGSDDNPFRYLGRHGILDEGDDLSYIRARYYDTEQQRFVSKDLNLGQQLLSQSLNRYSYVSNSPIRFIDISGFIKETIQTKNEVAVENIQDIQQTQEENCELDPYPAICQALQDRKRGLTEEDKARLMAKQQIYLADAKKWTAISKGIGKIMFGLTVVKAGADIVISIADCVPGVQHVTKTYKIAKLGIDTYETWNVVDSGDYGSGLEFATRRTTEDVLLKGGAGVAFGANAVCGVGIGISIAHATDDVGEAWKEM